MRTITKVRRSIRAISPVISVLLMIAIAVAASLVAYAWVMGYMGFTTTKVGKAVQIQSISRAAGGNLLVYVQNVGDSQVQLSQDSVYVGDALKGIAKIDDTPTTPATYPFLIAKGDTATIEVDTQANGEPVKVKVVTTDGQAAEMSFSENSYSVPTQFSVDFVASGGSTSPTGTQTYDVGSTVPISATSDGTHSFIQWTATGSITFDDYQAASTNAHINGAGTITAQFDEIQYSVTFVLGTGGATINPAAGSHTYVAGSSVPISATAGSTYVFSQWSSDTASITFDDASLASTNAHVTGAGTITANFVTQVTFVSAGTAKTAATGDVQPSYPTGWAAGDLIILQVLGRGESLTIPTPSGFTPLPLAAGWTSDSSGTVTGLRVTQALFYRFAATGDPTSTTVSVSGLYSRGAIMYAFRNVATSNFLESVINPANIGSTAPLVSQTVTSVGPKRLAVTFFGFGDNPAIGTFAGYTERSEINIAFGGTNGDLSKSRMGLDTAEMATPAILNSGTATANNHDWILRSFALVPR